MTIPNTTAAARELRWLGAVIRQVIQDAVDDAIIIARAEHEWLVERVEALSGRVEALGS